MRRLTFSIALLGALPSIAVVHAQGVFDKGGALSIDKPLNKGGGLSIDKVYVPEELRIGRVQSLAEVIIPVCWGSPQDCRGMEPEKSKAATNQMVHPQYPYYITARFICRIRKTDKISGKECDVTEASSNSCDEALEELGSRINSIGDPCATCSNIADPSEYWKVTDSPQHIQDGICSGR